MTKEQIQKEIEEMDSYLPVSKIEERLNMPPTTLQKVLSGKRELPKKWVKVLEAYFVKPIPKKEIKIQDANKQSNSVDNLTELPPKTNFTVNTTETKNAAYMNDAIKKKLGIK